MNTDLDVLAKQLTEDEDAVDTVERRHVGKSAAAMVGTIATGRAVGQWTS